MVMTGSKIIPWLTLLFLLTTISSCKYAPGSTGNTLSPAELRAGGIAYEAFNYTLANKKTFHNDISEFARSIDNYDVAITDDDDHFTFTFKIKLFRGRTLKDGWFVYVVNKGDWRVQRIAQ